ncbi:IPT/TIG domain-containing protein [Maribacter caenipelagi]|uniref:IPT/TIG domain-containing protein n=1 Tax=Maribacter caenipelagi TaxID=1447781 RepID=A0A4R7D3P2_9FLAO|nr:IPT/TIG domain-containing protein [Maribacter caenipelagi]TDS14224.1 IPT/TIG domain-containing protein [Maribacter caenipelagi]
MNKISLSIIVSVLLLLSCTKEENSNAISKPSFTSLPSALIEEEIVIDGQNFEQGKLQVFFDNEESYINYLTDKKIKVKVPRSIERYNPTVRIVDLKTNENILEETFILKKPVIKGYDKQEISFQEVLVIQGENFDKDRDFVKVSINGESASVIRASHNEVEVYIPTALAKSNLVVELTAQFQKVVSEESLKLTKPIITNVPDDFWAGQELVLEGSGFNPDGKFTSILVDGKESSIFSGVTHTIRSSYPSGPYKDFFINEVVYKMADYEIILNGNWEIKNDGIIVDYEPGYITHPPIVHNNKAYAYFWKNEGLYDTKVALYEFTPDSQEWEEVPGSSYLGYINNVVYNNDGFLYAYKNPDDSSRILIRINLNTLEEELIPLPFSDNRQATFMLHFQEKLYVLNGEAVDDNYNLYDVEEDWRFDEITSTWSELVDGTMSGHFANRETGYWGGFLHEGALYMNYNNTSHRLNPNLSLDTLDNEIYMVYQNTLITSNGSRGGFRDFEADYTVSGVEHNLGFARELRHFFQLNNEIYFRKGQSTYKLKKEILDEIL